MPIATDPHACLINFPLNEKTVESYEHDLREQLLEYFINCIKRALKSGIRHDMHLELLGGMMLDMSNKRYEVDHMKNLIRLFYCYIKSVEGLIDYDAFLKHVFDCCNRVSIC